MLRAHIYVTRYKLVLGMYVNGNFVRLSELVVRTSVLGLFTVTLKYMKGHRWQMRIDSTEKKNTIKIIFVSNK